MVYTEHTTSPFRACGKKTVEELFSKQQCHFKRFKLLVRLLHFGDKSTQEERCQTDKFAPTREVFNDFMANCEAYYTLSDSITINETLHKFRGRCPFKVYYMPNKPGKYGILFRVLTDAKARYVYKMIP